jgi:hypothetical protein
VHPLIWPHEIPALAQHGPGQDGGRAILKERWISYSGTLHPVSIPERLTRALGNHDSIKALK